MEIERQPLGWQGPTIAEDLKTVPRKFDGSLVFTLKSEEDYTLDEARSRMWGSFAGFNNIAGPNHTSRQKQSILGGLRIYHAILFNREE